MYVHFVGVPIEGTFNSVSIIPSWSSDAKLIMVHLGVAGLFFDAVQVILVLF